MTEQNTGQKTILLNQKDNSWIYVWVPIIIFISGKHSSKHLARKLPQKYFSEYIF